MKSFFLTLFAIICCSFVSAQTDTLHQDSNLQFIDTIRLPEVVVFGKERKFISEEARKQYLILRNRVKKVYPYAKLAADRLEIMQQTMDTMRNKRVKKLYTKRMQKYIEDRFTDELKKLSRSQGRILVKLIHRQTGKTAFQLVKDLRNGWSAFMYNSTAWLYDISLKTEYNPTENNEDLLIEEILLRAFANDELEYQAPAFEIDFGKILDERRKNRK
ncbi:DUF4294 domain-containing protein [Capnocytophaga cynodegmi]|uniref:DUF4294 domain-containing protein n=1 Tax=Capnocytophaga cynodegmi TaxID=28189 RepID=A0A0B7HHI1_9FLAO|nr:DUF4294 domain-containing protein [Capnocytophaga cynodegmi]CEN37013.1 conserved exported hypothetical protein [Capnocytophaga cynodegmi]CEN38985.1 conserved exported hypothetical protein [Capnocytophaga cynodegmi]